MFDFEPIEHPIELNMDRVMSLVHLINLCTENDIKVVRVRTFMNGFQVLFEGFEGDVILHDRSYGNNLGLWETYRFPWDYGDVSTHTAEELVDLLQGNPSL